jgi:hypothetical protein
LNSPYMPIYTVTTSPGDWHCSLFGGCITVEPPNGKIPNWFHRKIHRLLLGFVWTKKK